MTSTEWGLVIYVAGYLVAVLMCAFSYDGENKDNGGVLLSVAMGILVEALLSWVLVIYLILLRINRPRQRPSTR
jgi:hypothetical protein